MLAIFQLSSWHPRKGDLLDSKWLWKTWTWLLSDLHPLILPVHREFVSLALILLFLITAVTNIYPMFSVFGAVACILYFCDIIVTIMLPFVSRNYKWSHQDTVICKRKRNSFGLSSLVPESEFYKSYMLNGFHDSTSPAFESNLPLWILPVWVDICIFSILHLN